MGDDIMDTEILQNVITIAETLSITKAAEKLFISESVLSRQLARVEKEMGVQLFIRKRSGLVLTYPGEIICNAIRQAFQTMEDALHKAKSIQAGKQDVITIGLARYHALTSEACQFFSNFNSHHPGIELNFLSMEVSVLLERLLKGQIDFIYGALNAYENTQLCKIPIEHIDTCMIVSSQHPALVTPKEFLTLRDFQEDLFLILEDQYEMKTILCDLGKESGFMPKIKTMSDMSSLLTSIQFGNGVACSVRTNTFFTANRLTTVPIPEFQPISLGLIYKQDSTCIKFPELIHTAHIYSQR